MKKDRIELLDSFRAIAILGVLLYHYTVRWVSFYPYGNAFGNIFGYGSLGVHFFFMISGFVIAYTLENSGGHHNRRQGLLSFFVNRFARLFPPMLLCSVFTLIIIRLLDHHYLFDNAHRVKNILPGITFIHPHIWSVITKENFAWINGSYWSLWVEVQFYIISGALYFLNKKNFFRNILLAGIIICLVKYIPIYFLSVKEKYFIPVRWVDFFSAWRRSSEIFNLSFFIGWFMPGIVFYYLYKRFSFAASGFKILVVVAVCCLVLDIRLIYNDFFYSILLVCFLMMIFFLLMIYNKEYLSFLQHPILYRIGIISYSMYLIHEDIGVLLINKFGGYLGRLSILSPFIVIVLVIAFAELSYRFYERKVAIVLKRTLKSWYNRL